MTPVKTSGLRAAPGKKKNPEVCIPMCWVNICKSLRYSHFQNFCPYFSMSVFKKNLALELGKVSQKYGFQASNLADMVENIEGCEAGKN